MSQTDTIQCMKGFETPVNNNILGGRRTYHKKYLAAEKTIIKM